VAVEFDAVVTRAMARLRFFHTEHGANIYLITSKDDGHMGYFSAEPVTGAVRLKDVVTDH
jgi:hypothetical protein